MKKAVIGLVRSRADADAVVTNLQSHGFALRDISALLPDREGARDFAHVHNTKAPEGAIAGAGAGGVLGGTLGMLAGIGAFAIPGLGVFIAAGPLLAAMSGVAVGATVGSIAGALVGSGIPEIEAKLYEGKLRSGNILIAVHAETAERQRRASEVLAAAGADKVGMAAEAALPRDELRTSRR
ncbi:MAG: hypothetical protein QM778_34360 [Myxococcales bacterium]